MAFAVINGVDDFPGTWMGLGWESAMARAQEKWGEQEWYCSVEDEGVEGRQMVSTEPE